MSCIVPSCSAPVQEYLVEFPRNSKLADRWKEAIEFGTGRNLPETDELAQQQRQVCLAHFSGIDNPGMVSYQEPCCFNNRAGEPVEVSSCRLCLRFQLRSRMFSKSGKIEHASLSNTIRAVMKVSLGPEDFLTEICERCLIKVDVLKCWAREALQQEMDFRELMNFIRKETQDDTPVKVEVVLLEAKEEPHDVEPVMQNRSRTVSPLVVEPDPEQGNGVTIVNNHKKTVSNKGNSSSDEDNVPLSRLPKRGRKVVSADKDLVVIVKKRRGRQTKPKLKVPKEKSLKKKRDRKPGSSKPVKPEYIRHILDKKCYICDVILENNDDLVAHLTEIHAGKDDYKCDDCNKAFEKVTVYNRHLSFHDNSIRPRKCGFCSLCFSAKESLNIHENKEHGANHVLPKRNKRRIKVAQCESCGKIFRNDLLLKQHDQFQHQKLPAATCKLCGKTFATKPNLEKHYIVHSQERPYKCDKCPASFKTSTPLTKHALLHQNVLPYECCYCEERFLTKGQYAKHRVLNHKNQDPKQQVVVARSMLCGLCPQVYSRSIDLQKHIFEAHFEQPYPYITCPECSQQFLQQHQLTVHMNVHTDLYVCEICDKHHSSANQLRDHMETHNPSQPWQCTICLRRFTLQSNFSRHRLIHQEEKRFKCDLCDKQFTQKGQLTNHRRTHTGERPFACPVCGKSFGDKPTFYKHRKRCMEKDGTLTQQDDANTDEDS